MTQMPAGATRITPGRWRTCGELLLLYTDGTAVRSSRTIYPGEFEVPADDLGDPNFHHAFWAPRGAWVRPVQEDT